MKNANTVIAISCMLVSTLVTVQAKSVFEEKEEIEEEIPDISFVYIEDLQADLIEEQNRTRYLYEQIELYRNQLDIFQKTATEVGGYSEILNEQLTQAKLIAGLTNVYGEGVIVTMKDSDEANIYNLNENNYIIHDEDILRVINELRSAGAEAISINGERILSTSEIICAGSTVSINNRKFSAPYTIKAIGNSTELFGALTMRQGVVEILSKWGIVVDVVQYQNITIDAYDGIIINQFALEER